MSWGTCTSGSNNIHFDFPPIMADGRNFASWQPGAKISDDIREQAGIKSNWQYRKYMTENADSIMKHNKLIACDQCSSCPAIYGVDEAGAQATPFLFKSRTDKSQPFGYENSDLKELYLSKHQLQSRLYTPVLTQAQLLEGGYQNYN